MSNKMKNILEEYVKGLIKVIGQEMKRVILFGSYARGEELTRNEISDIDI